VSFNFNKTDYDVKIPCQFSKETNKNLIFYSLMYNYTLAPYLSNTDEGHSTSAKYDSFFKLKMSIDNSILNVLS